MKFKKAMKIVKKLDSVAQLSMKAKITMLEELTGIEDGETLTKEILAQGVTLENVALANSAANKHTFTWTKDDVERMRPYL